MQCVSELSSVFKITGALKITGDIPELFKVNVVLPSQSLNDIM